MPAVKASIILPIHDPQKLLFPLLEQFTPQLKTLYTHAFVSVSPTSEKLQKKYILRLQNDSFFTVNFNQPDSQTGDQFLSAYTSATTHSDPQTMLHSCDLDKVACYLSGQHKADYINDIQWANQQSQPVLFQRSEAAWQTFPENYRIIEHYAIDTGKMLFNQTYDFACSHFAMQSHLLASLLPHIHGHDFRILLEIILLVRDQLLTKNVDWLEWEDPFVLGRDPQELRQERDASPYETYRRLQYVVPFLQMLYELIPDLLAEEKTL